MEAAKKEEKGNASEEIKKGKGKWDSIWNFLAMGGFLLVLIFIVGIALLINILLIK